jgi:hypothetical protein
MKALPKDSNGFTQYPKAIRELLDHGGQPEMWIDLPNHSWAKLYWTKSSGQYGHQMITVYCNGKDIATNKTSGCGYSKLGSSLENLFRFIGSKPKEYQMNSDSLYPYHIGGNYYRINQTDLEPIA